MNTMIRHGLYLLFSMVTAWSALGQDRPNIIFLFADDLGWGDLGCYGHPHIQTPNIDKLAFDGRMMVNWYANASVCSPSRATVMTGQYAQRDRVFEHFAGHEANQRRHMPDALDPNQPVLPRLLQQAGYATAHYGKWHLSSFRDENVPRVNEYGYDESRCHAVIGENQDRYLNRLKPGELPNTRSAEWEVSDALDFFDRHREDQPVFINLWFQVPHTVLLPNEEQKKPYHEFRAFGRWAEHYAENLGVTGYSTPQEIYYATVTELDRQVGRLIDQLKEWGELDNTLIVFSSDNGPESIHVPGAWHSGVGSPGVFRGEKRSLYEGGIRVPGIIRWPVGGVTPGIIDRKAVGSCMDLYPTFLAAAGVELPENHPVDGVNLLPLFRGEEFDRTPLFWEFNESVYNKNRLHRNPRLAMREGPWKLLVNPDGSRLELYNLEKDPSEVDNVGVQHPEIASEMQKKVVDWFQGTPASEFPTNRRSTNFENILGIHSDS